MKKILGAVAVAVVLVGCSGGGGGDSESCKAIADLEALIMPDGHNFDSNNDGYLNMAEQFNEFTNNDLKQDIIDLKEIYPDC